MTDAEAALLVSMSAATIDRHLAPERAKLFPRGRSHTKPGTLLKSQIPIRTWAEWTRMPGFVEIDLVGHEGGNSSGEFCFTLTVTDVFTGWTINRSVKNKAAIWVIEAIEYVIAQFPFPILGIDSDNGSEFINPHLFDYCTEHKITFTRSRSGNRNDGAHVEQKNWTHVRELVGYLRFDTEAELGLLNEIWELDWATPTTSWPSKSSSSNNATGPRSPSVTTGPPPRLPGQWLATTSAQRTGPASIRPWTPCGPVRSTAGSTTSPNNSRTWR